MQPIDPTTEIPITLQAQDWNTLMEIVGRYSTMVAIITGMPNQSPLLQRLGTQLQQAAGKLNGSGEPVQPAPQQLHG
jgi:hypothetical protein